MYLFIFIINYLSLIFLFLIFYIKNILRGWGPHVIGLGAKRVRATGAGRQPDTALAQIDRGPTKGAAGPTGVVVGRQPGRWGGGRQGWPWDGCGAAVSADGR